MKVYLVYSEGSSDKFWSAEAEGKTLTVVFGRRGSKGTTKATKFSSAEACLAEARKLVQQKRSKGYVEEGVTAGAAPAASPGKKTPAKKASKKGASATPDAPRKLRRPPAPSAFATAKRHPEFETFDPDDLDLFHLGFPELVLLDDEHPHDAKVERWAKTALDGVDPVYTTVWPTQVALAYAFAFPTTPREDPERFAERMAAYRKDPTPTADTVRTLLEEFMPGDEVYSGWRAPPALYTLEHFLGAEMVAAVIVECLAELDAEALVEGRYDHVRIVLEVLGYLMLRMPDDGRARIQKAIDAVRAGRKPRDLLSDHLALLPDRPLEMPQPEYENNLGPWFMGELSVSSWQRWKSFDRHGPSYLDVRAVYLDGPARLPKAEFKMWLDGISKRSMLKVLDTYGRVKHPGTVRMVLALGKFKSMTQELTAWRARHADYVESVLPQLASDPYVKKGLEVLGVQTKPMKKVKDPMVATEKLLEQLEKQLPKAFPDQNKVTALVRAAADEAREIARLDGQDYPEVYFVNLWAEFPFSLELSDANFELLSNAYEEVIVSGEASGEP